MRVITGCLLTALFAVVFTNLYAQEIPSSIQGKVLTDKYSAAESSTIVLLRSNDSSVVSSAIAGKTGAFLFNNLKPGSYLLRVTLVGYNKSYTGPYTVLAGKVLQVAEITLSPSAKQLGEVTVVSNKPDIEVKPGRVILNVQNSLTAAGNSAFDILRQSPGVRIDNANNISIVGKQNALITIDGKPTNLTGDDLVGVLRGMQSNVIERIELITSGSAKYDASAGGIINIILKKGSNIGTNITVTGTAGYGKYYKSNAGVVFNSRTAKFNVFGNYNFTDDKTFHDFVTDRGVTYNDVTSDYHVDYNSIQKSYNHSFSIGADYSLSPTQTIGFLVNGFVRQENYLKDNSLKISNQGVMDSVITANSMLNRHVSRINYNLNYNAKLGKSGKTLSADANYTTYDRNSAEYITNEFYNSTYLVYRYPEWLQNLSPSTIHIWLSKVDFYDPISKTSKLEAGIKYNNTWSNNDLIFGPFENGQYQVNSALSSHFVYTENVTSGYVNYENKFNKFDLTAGLRAEQTSAKGSGNTVNNNYFELFPQVQLSYKQDDKNDFTLSYNRGIHRPAYEDLNPFLYYVDLYDYGAGNPNLKPEFSNLVQFTYSYNKTFQATLYTNIINDAYEFPFYEQNDTSKVNITTHKNLGKVYNYGLRINVPVIFTNWWNATFNADVAYQRYVAYPFNGNLNKGTQDVILSSAQHFILSKTLNAEVSGSYESPTFYGINHIKAYYFVNAGIGKQLFNKRGSIKLSVNDVFNTLRDRIYTNYQNLNLSLTDKKESQIGRLTFTYRFGKASVKSNVTHNTGNEEEQKRTRSTVN
ncbi:TonB-dependent receptor domain-containing protein [Mucilaginibacter sp.]|uniref:TonB-dependent receptor domain-containing protein n=1 Tax=Mucilaginibacter sp. TaxID=1882438 RepID=UPI003D1145E0